MFSRFATLVLLLPLSAQQAPDAKTLLDQSARALEKYRSYQYESEVVADVTFGGSPMMKTTASYSCTGINPDKMRAEVKSQTDTMTVVSDGKYVWTYVPRLKQYTKKPAVQGPEAVLQSFGLRNMPDTSSLISGAKTVRADSIEVDGKKHDCWVVEVRIDKLALPDHPGVELTDGVITQWIDKASSLNLQMTMSGKMQLARMPAPVEIHQKFTVHGFKFDAPLPDSLFTFTPPEGAKEVPDLPGPG